MNFSSNLIFLRKKKGYTLDEIATKIGFSRSQWNNYELGSSYPKFLDFIKISKYFDISETDLIHKNLELDSGAKTEKYQVTNIDYKELADARLDTIESLKRENLLLREKFETKEGNNDKSKSGHSLEFHNEPKPELNK